MSEESNSTQTQPGIAGAYKRKEYGWFVAYISVVVLATRLGGALGAAMSILVMTVLYKIIKNTSYSTTKKILLSIGSIVGGLLATYLSRYTAYMSFPSIPTLVTFIRPTRWNRYGPSIGRYSTRPRHPSASSMELFRKIALAV
jgi:hypothetical protein